MVVKLNTVRLNGASLNSVALNGVGDRLRASAGGGGGEVIPPEEPDVPDVPVTYTLSASASNGVVSASVNGKSVTLPYTANEGDVIVLEVTADEGFMFEGWSDGNTDNPRSITMAADVTLSATCVVKAVEKEYIQFADAEVERVLMANGVSSDGVGITKEDAAAVTTIGTWFRGNTEITSFDEFRFFGVSSLSIQSFYGCTSLKSITIPSSVSEIPGYGVFQNCTSLQRVTFNGDITGIYNEAFQGCSALSDINIPESVAGFGNSAFNGCTNMRIHLYLPNLITDNQWDTSRVFANTGILSANFPNVQKLGGDFFAGSKELVKVDIGASAVSIGSSLCNGCTSLTTLICRAVTPPSIGNNIIANAPNAYIYVPDASVEAYRTATNWISYADRIHPLSEIEGSPYITFADPEVERVLMENNVSSDGVGITMADAQAVTSIGTWFKGNTAIVSFDELEYFTGLTDIYGGYPNGAFMNCTSLQSIRIPEGVTSIEGRAFLNCTALTNVTFPNTLNSIRYEAFNKAALTNLNVVLDNVTTIGEAAFRQTGLRSVVLPRIVTITSSYGSAGISNTFAACANLQYALLGESCTNVGSWGCFQDSAITALICLATTPPSGGSICDNTPISKGSGYIYVPDASVDAYKATESNGWAKYSSRIKGISQLATDNPTLYAEIQQYL